jgi:DNA-binding MarR family transcriptional regulator
VNIALQKRVRLSLESVAPVTAPGPMFDLIELFFFAYRDFVGDADRLLARYGFGRAHHRVLHFVMRQPGLTIADLLDILQITKQSLNRVMKELLDQGFIESRHGTQDRRQRLLFPAAKGHRLALDLAELQSRRFERVFGAMGHGAKAWASDFLLAMIDEENRERARPRAAEPAGSDGGIT